MLRKLLSKFKTTVSYFKMGNKFGADIHSKWLLSTMLMRFNMRRMLGLNTEKTYIASIRIGKFRHGLSFRAQDICIVREMLERSPYLQELSAAPINHILDLGAHIGLATLCFREKYPEARICCYEPDPENYRLLESNLQSLAGISLRNMAIGMKVSSCVRENRLP